MTPLQALLLSGLVYPTATSTVRNCTSGSRYLSSHYTDVLTLHSICTSALWSLSLAEFTDLHYGFSGVTSERLGGRKDKPSHFITSQITYFASSAFATCAVPHISEHSTTVFYFTFGFLRDLPRFSLISSAKPAVIVPAWKDLLFILGQNNHLWYKLLTILISSVPFNNNPCRDT